MALNLQKLHLKQKLLKEYFGNTGDLERRENRESLPGSEALWAYQPVLPHFHPHLLGGVISSVRISLTNRYYHWQLLVLNLLASHEPEKIPVY